MIVKQVTRTIKIQKTFWACKNPDHHHKTQAIAEKCVNKRIRNRQEMKAFYRDKAATELAMVECYLAGDSYSAIAQKFSFHKSGAVPKLTVHTTCRRLLTWRDGNRCRLINKSEIWSLEKNHTGIFEVYTDERLGKCAFWRPGLAEDLMKNLPPAFVRSYGL